MKQPYQGAFPVLRIAFPWRNVSLGAPRKAFPVVPATQCTGNVPSRGQRAPFPEPATDYPQETLIKGQGMPLDERGIRREVGGGSPAPASVSMVNAILSTGFCRALGRRRNHPRAHG